MKKAIHCSLQIILLLFTVLIISLFAGRHCSQMIASISSINNKYVTSLSAATNTQPVIDHGRLNINIASERDLTYLPGIGETLAARIVEYREENGPFLCIEDLKRVEGIGETRLKTIAQYIAIGD